MTDTELAASRRQAVRVREQLGRVKRALLREESPQAETLWRAASGLCLAVSASLGDRDGEPGLPASVAPPQELPPLDDLQHLTTHLAHVVLRAARQLGACPGHPGHPVSVELHQVAAGLETIRLALQTRPSLEGLAGYLGWGALSADEAFSVACERDRVYLERIKEGE